MKSTLIFFLFLCLALFAEAKTDTVFGNNLTELGPLEILKVGWAFGLVCMIIPFMLVFIVYVLTPRDKGSRLSKYCVLLSAFTCMVTAGVVVHLKYGPADIWYLQSTIVFVFIVLVIALIEAGPLVAFFVLCYSLGIYFSASKGIGIPYMMFMVVAFLLSFIARKFVLKKEEKTKETGLV